MSGPTAFAIPWLGLVLFFSLKPLTEWEFLMLEDVQCFLFFAVGCGLKICPTTVIMTMASDDGAQQIDSANN